MVDDISQVVQVVRDIVIPVTAELPAQGQFDIFYYFFIGQHPAILHDGVGTWLHATLAILRLVVENALG
jgi:hypothetical protein